MIEIDDWSDNLNYEALAVRLDYLYEMKVVTFPSMGLI